MSFEAVDDIKSLTQSQVNKLTNAQLKNALMTMIQAERNSPSNAVLLEELKKLKKDIEDIKLVKQEVKQLNTRLDDAFKIIQQQQKFLESIDARERQKKLIITGIPEDDGGNDPEKIKALLDKAGYQENYEIENWDLKRLGEFNASRKRPILLVVENQERRNAILDKAKNLKGAGPPFSNIYIKKDIHPAVRKELGRLRRREKEERDKPENQGTNIKYDAKERVLLRDGVIIDRYTPNFF